MNEGGNLGLALHDFARQAPLIIHPHDLDLLQNPPNGELGPHLLLGLLPLLLLLVKRGARDVQRDNVLREAEGELLRRRRERVPQDARLDFLADLEVPLGVEAVEVEEVDGAVEVAEELEVQAGGEGGGDEGGDEGTGEDGGDGGGGGELKWKYI